MCLLVYLFVCMCLCICLYVCLCVCLFVCLFVCLRACLFVRLLYVALRSGVIALRCDALRSVVLLFIVLGSLVVSPIVCRCRWMVVAVGLRYVVLCSVVL